MTASHCSPTIWHTDYNQYFQHSLYENYVGVETYDPDGYWCGLEFVYECRKSAAAFVKLAIPADSVRFGHIARTAGLGSRIIDSERSTFVIDHSDPYPETGTEVEMMGQRSGWTHGKVIDNCVDVDLENDGHYHIYECQVWATYEAADGDSGAPVFGSSEWTYEVTLYGMHFGSLSDGTTTFSPMGGIQNDLGDLKTFDPDPINYPIYGEGCDSTTGGVDGPAEQC